MINEARNYYSINFVSRFDESSRYWLTDKIDSRKSIGMLSVSLPRSVSSMLFIYSFNFFSLSLQSIPLFLEIWISPPLEAAEISIEEGKERKRKEKHRTKLFNAALLSTIGRSIERKKWEKLGWKRGERDQIVSQPRNPVTQLSTRLPCILTLLLSRAHVHDNGDERTFRIPRLFPISHGEHNARSTRFTSPRCRSLKIVLTKRFDRSNEVKEEVNNSL